MGKEQDRQRIARETKAFLLSGGSIKVVPSKTVCPPSMQWAADRGYDYSTWTEIGSGDWYESFGNGVDVDVDQVSVED